MQFTIFVSLFCSVLVSKMAPIDCDYIVQIMYIARIIVISDTLVEMLNVFSL